MEFNIADVKDLGLVGAMLFMFFVLALRAGKFCAPLIKDCAYAHVSYLTTVSEQIRLQTEHSKLQTQILDGLLSSSKGIAEDQRNHTIILDEVREIVKGQKCCQSSSSIVNAG